MPPQYELIGLVLSALTIVALGSALTIAVALIGAWYRGLFRSTRALLGAHGLRSAFVVAACATGGSLFLSAVAGLPPCDLCWYQRIFMFPLPIILGAAMYMKDVSGRVSAMLLAAVGACIAAYHIALQLGAVTGGVCPPGGVDCAGKLVIGFSFVTIPVMSFAAFSLIIALLAAQTTSARD